MGRLAHRIADKRVLGLIRRYLEAGVLAHGVVIERHAGTPQGGPLSPLLANVLLDEVDKELERRGHAFVRYADDLNVYVRSRAAGERVMAALRRLFAALRLRVNEAKSAVARATQRPFLGFSFCGGPGGMVRRRLAPQALQRLKDRVRALTRRSAGRSLAAICADLGVYLTGWKAYFRLAETPGVFAELDKWVRHRLRAVQLKHWRRGTTIYRELRARDERPRGQACGGQWPALVAQLRDGDPHRAPERAVRPAGRAPAGPMTSTPQTARCGPACRVVWQGERRHTSPSPYADQRGNWIASPSARNDGMKARQAFVDSGPATSATATARRAG